jgi:PAS domain S-box-containing protein
MELYSFPLMDDQGNVIGVIEHVRDITERKRAEEALKNSEAKSRALFENAGAAIFIADGATGEIIDCNQTAENLIGRSRREIIGLHQTQLHPTDKAEEYRKMFVGHLSKTCINNYEAEVQHKDGRIIPVMINGAALKINDREIIIGVFLDITGRKRAEEGLKEAKAQAELYLDLMGHDIRNMNMIGMGFLELALGSPDISKKDKDLLLMSLGSLENSTRLIENVRKLQKARSGELKHHTVDACQTFMRVLAHYSNMPDVNASFNLDLPPSCPVMANELLYEVFENIVGNAIKHGGPEPFVDIKFDQVAADGRTYNSFIVEDNGPGIPDAIKDRIFNRLQRGDTKAKGMGLGLYLVKSLVESYGGRVCVEDRIAGDHTKGTRFVVMLPAVDK